METRLVHEGGADDQFGAVSTPIYQVSTFRQQGLDNFGAFEYSRVGNPTRQALETQIANLEGGSRAFAFASGVAATTAAIMLLKAGDHVIATADIYGGTHRLLTGVFQDYGISATFVDGSDLAQVAKAIRPDTRAVVLETPSNPTLKIVDIRGVASMCRARGILCMVDNTFMSPLLQRPLELGADLVFHSASKYLCGHSDLIAGLVVVQDPDLAKRLHFVQYSTGGILGPFDSWLVLRGIKTLAVRMACHEQNTARVANWLRSHPKVKKVYWTGFPDHPGHQLHCTQASGFGAVLSFDVGSPSLAKSLLSRVDLCALASSLGGVETLISLPAFMSHGSVPREEREALGITEGLVRLSVGIEHVDDIIADLDQALDG